MGGRRRGSREVPEPPLIMTRGASRAALASKRMQGLQKKVVGDAVGEMES